MKIRKYVELKLRLIYMVVIFFFFFFVYLNYLMCYGLPFDMMFYNVLIILF